MVGRTALSGKLGWWNQLQRVVRTTVIIVFPECFDDLKGVVEDNGCVR